MYKSNPSHSFLTVTALTSLRSGSSILYTVDGVTPASRASSVNDILRSAQICLKRSAIASFTFIQSPTLSISSSFTIADTYAATYTQIIDIFSCRTFNKVSRLHLGQSNRKFKSTVSGSSCIRVFLSQLGHKSQLVFSIIPHPSF